MKTVPISKGVISKATYKFLFLLCLNVIGPYSPSSTSHWMQGKIRLNLHVTGVPL
jgi:hypothetical protein